MDLRKTLIRMLAYDEELEKNPVGEDLFWGTLAMLTVIVAGFFYAFFNWWEWFLLSVGGNIFILGMELARLRVPLLPKQRAARKVSLFIISDCIFLSLLLVIKGTLLK